LHGVLGIETPVKFASSALNCSSVLIIGNNGPWLGVS
jgi:hypothetical protein